LIWTYLIWNTCQDQHMTVKQFTFVWKMNMPVTFSIHWFYKKTNPTHHRDVLL
jgi:hypothetical protein